MTIYFSEAATSSTSLKLAIIAIVISIVAIIAPLLYHFWYQKKLASGKKEAVKAALLQEILANMHSLFNEGIERPFLFKIFESFLEKQSYQLKGRKSRSEFQKIISLYVELMDYRAVTDQYWPPFKYDDGGIQCTQKQVQTINKFLEYFGEEKLEDTYKLSVLQVSREKAQEIRNAKIKSWEKKLKARIAAII